MPLNLATESSIRLVTAIPGPKSLAFHQRRENAVPRGVGSMLPIYVSHASGATVEDVDGNRFLDFAGGIGCQNAGHGAPEAVAAIQQQAAEFIHTCFMVTPYEGYVEVAEQLNARAPGDFPKKTFLANSGAEAVENAIKIARNFTKRQAVIAFDDAFHGRTQLALTLTGKSHPYKTGFGPFAPEIYRIPYAYCFRCPLNLRYPECAVECARELELAFTRQVDAKTVAAVILEPILGEGGFVAPPAEWFAEITRICREHGILIIADEIQTGVCRTGSFYACEHFGFTPDIILTGKSIAGGLPLAAVTGRAEIMDAPGPGGLGGTFGGNPVACAAALGIFKTVDDLDLNRRATRIGRIFDEVTASWPTRFPLIGDMRGIGAMRAMELVTNRSTRTPATAQTKRLLAECHSKGLILLSAGMYGNVIRLLVPLVATDEQIVEGLAIMEQALVGLT